MTVNRRMKGFVQDIAKGMQHTASNAEERRALAAEALVRHRPMGVDVNSCKSVQG